MKILLNIEIDKAMTFIICVWFFIVLFCLFLLKLINKVIDFALLGLLMILWVALFVDSYLYF